MPLLKISHGFFLAQRLARSILHSLLSRKSEPKVPYRVNAHRRRKSTSSKTSFNLELRLFGGCRKNRKIVPKWWFFMVMHCGRIPKKNKQNKQKPKSSPPKKENSYGGKTHGFLEESWVLHVKLFRGKRFKHFGESAGLSSEISFFVAGKTNPELGKQTKRGMRYLAILQGSGFLDFLNPRNFPRESSGGFLDENLVCFEPWLVVSTRANPERSVHQIASFPEGSRKKGSSTS